MNLRNVLLLVAITLAAIGVAAATPMGPATAEHQVSALTLLDLIEENTAAIVQLKQPTRTAAVTLSDVIDVSATCTKGIWVGTGGNVAVKGLGDSTASTLPSVPSGTYVPGAYSRIMSTNTTAASVVCFYGP